MVRKILLSALAAATLAGCATDYGYRGGNGDYYYGQPRTEYRYYDPYGAYGSYGYGDYGYGSGYYYDRYGRLVYGNPYGYQGSAYYGYGSPWWYTRPRPPGGHDGHDGHDHDPGDHDDDRDGRRPPWRNFGNARPAGERVAPDGDEAPPRMRRPMPSAFPSPAPQREQRSIAPSAPRMRSDDGGGSRMGRAVRGSAPAPAADE
jgi:hypothetical protein